LQNSGRSKTFSLREIKRILVAAGFSLRGFSKIKNSKNPAQAKACG
jgi:hypothetical protein